MSSLIAPELRDSRYQSANAAMLEALARHAGQVPLAVLVATIVLIALSFGDVPHLLLAGWFALAVGVLLMRAIAFRILPSSDYWSVQAKVWLIMGVLAINGLVYGASSLSFFWIDDIDRALHTMVVAGMAAGVVASTLGFRPFVLAYIVPVLSTLALVWLILPDSKTTPLTRTFIAVLVVLFAVMVIRLARDCYAAFRDSFEMRTEKDELNRQLLEAVSSAESANAAKTRFLANASHELKQPLHSISLLAGALSIRELDTKSSQILDKIMQASSNLSADLDGLLMLSRLDASVLRPTIEPVNLTAAVSRVAGGFAESARVKGVHMSVQPGEKLFVNADRMMLDRILRSLLDNAVRFTDHGNIHVRAVAQDGQCAVSVTDTGIGISRDDQGRIFEDFFRGELAPMAERKGLGLGLTVAARLAAQQSGTLTANSTPGQGSEFVLYLPIAVVDPEQALADSRASLFANLKVLMIAPLSPVNETTCTVLHELGCAVTQIAQLDELPQALAGEPDILVVDGEISDDSSGVETIDKVRGAYRTLPTLLLLGPTDLAVAAPWDELGIRVVRRPLTLDKLASEMEQAINLV